MSPAVAARSHRTPRHTCRTCLVRHARFRYRGAVRADRDHDLCFRCFRALRDSMRSHLNRAAA
jgi:Zinc finger, ZZ type